MLEIYTRHPTFWLIALPVFLISFALIGTITNLAPILTNGGLSMKDAATMLGLLGGASWFSRIGLGIFLDRIHVRFLSAAMFLVTATGCALILIGASGALLMIAVVLVGLELGAETDFLTYTVSRYFRLALLAAPSARRGYFFAWGSALGVFVGSLSFDLSGSYAYPLALFTSFVLLAMAIILRLGAYRYQGHEAEVDLGLALFRAVVLQA